MKKVWFLLLATFLIHSCRKKVQIADNDNTIDEYFAVNKDSLLFKKSNELYFRCYSKENESYRYLSIVYLNDDYFSKELNEYGIEKVSNIIDLDSFIKINDTLFRDKNYKYLFKRMHSGGTLSVLSN